MNVMFTKTGETDVLSETIYMCKTNPMELTIVRKPGRLIF